MFAKGQFITNWHLNGSEERKARLLSIDLGDVARVPDFWSAPVVTSSRQVCYQCARKYKHCCQPNSSFPDQLLIRDDRVQRILRQLSSQKLCTSAELLSQYEKHLAGQPSRCLGSCSSSAWPKQALSFLSFPQLLLIFSAPDCVVTNSQPLYITLGVVSQASSTLLHHHQQQPLCQYLLQRPSRASQVAWLLQYK